MAGLLGVSDELKVFKCPNCGEYVSSNKSSCPKCFFEFSDEMKQSSIDTEDKEVKEANRKFYKSIMYVGIVFFLLGGALVLQTVVSVVMTGQGLFSFWSPVLFLVGLGQIIYGWNGARKEK